MNFYSMSRDLTTFLNTGTTISPLPENPQVGDFFYILRSNDAWNYCDQNGTIINTSYMFASGEAITADHYIALRSYNSTSQSTAIFTHPDEAYYTGPIITSNSIVFYDTLLSSYDIDYTMTSNYYKITLLPVSSNQTNIRQFFYIDSILFSSGSGSGNNGSGNTTACFSLQTMLKIINTLPKNKFYLMTKMKREDTKMYSVNYGSWGQLDFTHKHQFIYKNKVYTFEELIYLHPIFKKAIQKKSEPNEYVYNIYGSYGEKYVNNMVELGPRLIMMGGKIHNDSYEYFADVEKKIKNIIETEDIINFTIDKFINSGINSEMVHLVYVK